MINESVILGFLLVLTRVSAFIIFFPLFGQRQIPMLIKAGMATALTFFWFDADASWVAELGPADTFSGSILLVREFGIGLLLAFITSFILVPAKIAGAYVGQEVGLSLAAISDPGSVDQSTLMTKVLESISIFLFFALNLHHFVFICVHHSFETLQNRISLLHLPIDAMVKMFNDLPEFGLLMLAPIGICMFLLVVALSYLNKAAPTLNLFSVGMPIRSGLGLVCLLIFMPTLVESMQVYFLRVQQDIHAILEYFA